MEQTPIQNPNDLQQQVAQAVKAEKKKGKKKKWIVLAVIAVIIIVIAVATSGGGNNQPTKDAGDTTVSENKNVEVSVVDFSKMDKAAISTWASTNKVNCNIKDDYSDTVDKGAFVSQSLNAGDKVYEGGTITIIFSLGKKPSIENLNALAKAETYSKTMHMSKQAIYDQLTSEYGEKFPEDAAKYAIDNIDADWNANALAKAKTYQSQMNMSKSAIYDQLTSSYGEKFTASEAQYAIDHLE